MGTPGFAKVQLESLIADEHFNIVGVVTQPDRPAGRKLQLKPCETKILAEKMSIPVISPENVNNPEVIEQIKEFEAEACVVVAFGQIISDELLNLFDKKIVNVHGSLLPRWRGAAPIQRAIEFGDKKTGVCLQVLEKKLDSGPVIGVKRVDITKEMDALDLHDILAAKGAELLHIEFMDYLRGNLAPIKQDEALVTYAKKIEKSESKINWSDSATDIYNRFKGFKLGPGVFTNYKNKKLKIKKMDLFEEGKFKKGKVLKVDKDSFDIGCSEGFLRIFSVQPESKKMINAGEFLRGYDLKVGDGFE